MGVIPRGSLSREPDGSSKGMGSLPKLRAQESVGSRASWWNRTLGHAIGAVHITRVHLSDPVPMHARAVSVSAFRLLWTSFNILPIVLHIVDYSNGKGITPILSC